MPRNLDATQLIPRPVWENPRIQLLDDIWLLTIVAILVATGVPWFSSGFEVDLLMASWGMFGLGAVHVAFTMLGAPGRRYSRWRDRSLTLVHVAGVLLIAFIWQHVGGLQNPLFLASFALPVFGAIFLSRWHPYAIALVGILAVGVVALTQAPELRWYASGLGAAGSWWAALFGSTAPPLHSSSAGFYAPLNYLLVLLEVFAILLMACAVAAEYVGTIVERLNGRIVVARVEAERTQKMWSELIDQLPAVALLIDPFTLRITAASERASVYLHAEEMPLQGRFVLEALHFSYPDVVHDLIVGADGGAPSTFLRVADRLRATRVEVLHVMQKDRRLALLTIEDMTEQFYLRAALDAADHAALVIDARGIVLAFNKLAGGLFSGLSVGAEALKLLTQPDAPLQWWDPGIGGRRKMHLQIGVYIYQVTSSATALSGEEERIFTVALLPVANAGDVDPFATRTNPALLTNITGRLR
ncbi:MAG: hypothetical protein M3O06_08990 [Pseudomonadota bacterium]|nr:hypothetical protein [Pseudomonadota bacterium]